MKHKVRMLKTAFGVDDGQVVTETFFEGREYEIGESLLGAFFEMGAVDMASQGEAAESQAAEAKSEGDAPANKMKKAAPENKAKK